MERRVIASVAAAIGLLLTTPTAQPIAQAIPRSAPRTATQAGTQPPLGRLTLPGPTGPHRIGTVSLHLVDRSRIDPWLPSHPTRELMVQLWYPATTTTGHPRAPWLSPGATPHLEASLGIPPGVLTWPTTHASVGVPVDPGEHGRPVVLYSPAAGGDRSFGTVLVEELASYGYVVVTIDHTHDAGEVEFPDGRVEVASFPPDITDAVIAKALAVREADTRFVLDQLAAINTGRNPDAERRPLPPGLCGGLDLTRTGMFGHSLGGATAAATMHDDTRIKAGLNLDGSLLGDTAIAGSDRPFLLLGSDQAGPEDPTWDAFWANQRGWKRELVLTGSTHLSFTDFEVLYPQGGPLVGLTPEQITQVIGTLYPLRAVRVQRAYVRAFFDLHLRHQKDGHLLSKQSPRYPEIRFVR
jgi:Platelet-activating factor acetylhydrolase, isoform II